MYSKVNTVIHSEEQVNRLIQLVAVSYDGLLTHYEVSASNPEKMDFQSINCYDREQAETTYELLREKLNFTSVVV